MSTFGQTSTGTNYDNAGLLDYCVVRKCTLSEAGDITKVTLYLDSTGIDAKGVLYDDDGDGGLPGTLLAVSSEVSVPSGRDWLDFALSHSASAGDYWLGAIFGGNAVAFMAVGPTGATSRYAVDTYSDGPVSTWSGGGAIKYDLCVYGTYTVGGAAALWVPSHLDGGLYERMAGGL